jgi:DNA repair protein RadC
MTQAQKKTKTPATIRQFKITKVSEAEEISQTQVTSSEDAYNVIRQFWYDDIEVYESFFILLLNRNNTTIGWAKISQGGVTGTVADPKIILKYALDSLACGVILAHNHPSGNLTPSREDKNLTFKIKEGLKLIDCNLIDHLILTPSNGYYSFGDGGEL